MNLMSTFVKPMHPEGWRFVGVFAAVTLVLFWLWAPLGWVGLGLTVWCYYFFRDPVRQVPQSPGLLVSPADGVVSLIEPAVPPPGLDMPPVALLRVSVFMSVFNCHVNRAPLAGTVGAVAYHKGQFLSAALDKASDLNERNAIRIDDAEGRQVAVVQIAGLVARRILCWVRPGAALRRGERFGLIRFGSRLDVYLPRDAVVQVAVGQTMIAGETVIARVAPGANAELGRPE